MVSIKVAKVAKIITLFQTFLKNENKNGRNENSIPSTFQEKRKFQLRTNFWRLWRLLATSIHTLSVNFI